MIHPPVINPWIIAVTVMLATFMEVLDTSVANVALPHIAGSLSATAGGGHLGTHLLPGSQRHHSPDGSMVFHADRTQALLYDLRRAFYGQQFSLRHGAYSRVR